MDGNVSKQDINSETISLSLHPFLNEIKFERK